jgi:YegS/Rv2252/BmrU family lipid kinase
VRCVLIYNPASGRKRERRFSQLGQAADALTARGHQVQLIATTAPGSAIAQAKEAIQAGAEIVFACGGDGTIHEVMQAVVSESSVHGAALGIIPLGSANALARHLGLSLDPVKAALQQIDAAPQLIPIGKIQFHGHARYFIVMAGAGPDGALVYELLAAHKLALGRLAYYFHSARIFATRPFRPFEIEYTEAATGLKITRSAVSVMAVRVGSLGGLFNRLTSSGAALHDPHLRLFILSPPAWLSLPLWFLSGWLGLLRLNPFLRSVEVSSFSCSPSAGSAARVQADGELLGRIPVEVSLIPSALSILIPDSRLTTPGHFQARR